MVNLVVFLFKREIIVLLLKREKKDETLPLIRKTHELSKEYNSVVPSVRNVFKFCTQLELLLQCR